MMTEEEARQLRSILVRLLATGGEFRSFRVAVSRVLCDLAEAEPRFHPIVAKLSDYYDEVHETALLELEKSYPAFAAEIASLSAYKPGQEPPQNPPLSGEETP